jgi:phosphoglycerate dehydrogenase-like enzyme
VGRAYVERESKPGLTGMLAVLGKDDLIHFETRGTRPPVFRVTSALLSDAIARNHATVTTSLGEDLKDMTWLEKAVGFVTSIDVLCDPTFPLRHLARVAPKLRWIHVTGAGIEPLLPLDWLPRHVSLTNNSGVHVEKVRESAAMMLLMLNARLPAIINNQHKAVWQQMFTPTIAGRTVLIIGVGDMGGAVAAAARHYKLRVIGVRRSGAAHPDVERMYRPDELDDALPLADFVVLAAPLTNETAALIDGRRLALFKRGAGLINIGRAGLIELQALIDALKNATLSGAILDVYDPEPLPGDSVLWDAPNVILMPHVTSDDEQKYLPKTLDLVFENVRRLSAGRPLLNLVDPVRGY